MQITNPDYDLVLDRLHLYYDMQLVTFGINKRYEYPLYNSQCLYNHYTQKTINSIPTGDSPSSHLDKNTKAQSYMHLQVRKALHCLKFRDLYLFETAGVKILQRIGYEFYCEELFIVKHKSSYSCESAIYFNLTTTDIIKSNCNFDSYFNKTDITPTVLDGGDEMSWQIGQMISIYSATSIWTSQSKFQVSHMFWVTEVFCVIVE